jgi:hypothetical protein
MYIKHAEAYRKHCEGQAVYLCPEGFWVEEEGDPVPEDAHEVVFELTLSEAADLYPVAYSTLAQYAREGKLEARRSGATWLTTRWGVEKAINPPEVDLRAFLAEVLGKARENYEAAAQDEEYRPADASRDALEAMPESPLAIKALGGEEKIVQRVEHALAGGLATLERLYDDAQWRAAIREAAGTERQREVVAQHVNALVFYWDTGGEETFGLRCDVCSAADVVSVSSTGEVLCEEHLIKA